MNTFWQWQHFFNLAPPFLKKGPVEPLPGIILERVDFRAPSTRIQIFLKIHIHLSVLACRPHVAGVFGDENGAFRKQCPGWGFLKTQFSCCRVDSENKPFRKQ